MRELRQCDTLTDEFTFVGDSLYDNEVTLYPPPQKLMKNLRRWLHHCFAMTPSYHGNSLPHGIQHDTFSCGIFVINTFSHATFGERLLSGQDALTDRINWFIKLVTQCILEVDVRTLAIARQESTDVANSTITRNFITSPT